jgi:ribokinase
MPRGTIVVVGSSNMDMYILLDRLPAAGETLLGGDFQMQPGGKGANQAVAAARAGSAVYLVANIGNDLFGRTMTDTFQKERVAVDFISPDRANPTGVALIMVDSKGENLIAVAPGANSHLTPAQVRKARPRIREADFVLLQMEIPAETVAETIHLAYDDRIPIMLNAAPAPRAPLPAELLSKIDTLVVNEYEAGILTGKKVENDTDAERAANAFRKMGVKRVVITLGSKGALALGDETTLVPARKVEAVDTVGAGDAFCGALVTALAEGMAFTEAVSFANAAAALACTKVGAQASLPARVDIESFWKE